MKSWNSIDIRFVALLRTVLLREKSHKVKKKIQFDDFIFEIQNISGSLRCWILQICSRSTWGWRGFANFPIPRDCWLTLLFQSRKVAELELQLEQKDLQAFVSLLFFFHFKSTHLSSFQSNRRQHINEIRLNAHDEVMHAKGSR
jgi:hypothetical protein